MDKLFLGIITIGALYFLYKKLVNTKGCDGCGGSCGTKKNN
ncbi:MAG: FeoB-associated Cys-rich membrane protein [Campylobacterota bacterium]|nr:FeoB-associated Cys-rich membrane protein [Campylobacterota bacterium]